MIDRTHRRLGQSRGYGGRMALTTWLIDKSALSRIASANDEWLTRIQRGLVKITTVTLIEVGFSSRNGTDHRATLGEPPASSMPIASSFRTGRSASWASFVSPRRRRFGPRGALSWPRGPQGSRRGTPTRARGWCLR